jgi:energy-coupling factor transporter ATP-binding protein EcfA2
MSSAADPFSEHSRARYRARLNVLGGAFDVTSADGTLLGLAVEAFGGLPKHRFAGEQRRFVVRLVVTEHKRTWSARSASPPRPVLSAGAGLLCATVDAGNFAVVDVAMSRALVCVSRPMLGHRYHARYELVELAFMTLAARAQSLVPLHAACVGANGNGLLLMGESGAGKSTLSLHALAGGLRLLSEDSAFVALEGLRVTGIPNYLHVAQQTLRFVESSGLRRAIERSPVIERRSGARKFEVDLRELKGKIARAPLRLAATVFLSRRRAGRRPALRPLEHSALLARLRREQPYAAAMPNWRAFERRVADVPAYELRRTRHPDDAVRLLTPLL